MPFDRKKNRMAIRCACGHFWAYHVYREAAADWLRSRPCPRCALNEPSRRSIVPDDGANERVQLKEAAKKIAELQERVRELEGKQVPSGNGWQIQIEAEAGDEQVVVDAVLILESMLPYMFDNVAISSWRT